MKRVFVSVFFVLVAMIMTRRILPDIGVNLEYSGGEIKACFSCFPFRGFMDDDDG